MLAPDTAGRVTAIHFTAGQTVKEGAALVQLFDAPEQADRAPPRPRPISRCCNCGARRIGAQRRRVARGAGATQGRGGPGRRRRPATGCTHRAEARPGAVRRPDRHPARQRRPVPERGRTRSHVDAARSVVRELHAAAAGPAQAGARRDGAGERGRRARPRVRGQGQLHRAARRQPDAQRHGAGPAAQPRPRAAVGHVRHGRAGVARDRERGRAAAHGDPDLGFRRQRGAGPRRQRARRGQGRRGAGHDRPPAGRGGAGHARHPGRRPGGDGRTEPPAAGRRRQDQGRRCHGQSAPGAATRKSS